MLSSWTTVFIENYFLQWRTSGKILEEDNDTQDELKLTLSEAHEAGCIRLLVEAKNDMT